ncbi:two-component system response regulator MprA [Streptomyces puniciscabiei]|uniref:Two-component system response regulator MprA n=1 Tax=Streptomyces puniciscabiei TaxID=164348 RepID=A0A542SYM5_9ACTN|nr:response regulator transcription factor [Streptomyces puniciscabiei]TQK79720.1 two-component system response regulator MprA [Streptomyces puniciscabiei]
MRPRILIVEDDHALRDVLRRGLQDEEFDTVCAGDGATALRLATPDVAAVVLDVGLPDADGRDVCQALRAGGFLSPVLFLTARQGLADRLSGFSAGGDDYLPKPFHLAELAARLRAALRRSAPPAVPAAADGLVLDAVRHSATVSGRRVDLTPTEFRLLAALAAAGGELVRRRELLRAGWPEGAQVSDNTLDQYLTRLRRKLRAAGSERTIATARGIGHRLA